MMKYTYCDQELIQKMFEYCSDGRTFFSKTKFFSWLEDELRLISPSKIHHVKMRVSGIYGALTRMGFMPGISYRRTIDITETLLEGLTRLLKRGQYQPPGWLRNELDKYHPIHFLELEDVDPEELITFKNLLRDEVK